MKIYVVEWTDIESGGLYRGGALPSEPGAWLTREAAEQGMKKFENDPQWRHTPLEVVELEVAE